MQANETPMKSREIAQDGCCVAARRGIECGAVCGPERVEVTNVVRARRTEPRRSSFVVVGASGYDAPPVEIAFVRFLCARVGCSRRESLREERLVRFPANRGRVDTRTRDEPENAGAVRSRLEDGSGVPELAGPNGALGGDRARRQI